MSDQPLETKKVECPECGDKHINYEENCRCCGEQAVEIGVHRPVLCLECTKALEDIRDEIYACPNCGQRGSYEGKCWNDNCRVDEFKPLDKDASDQMILEERGLS